MTATLGEPTLAPAAGEVLMEATDLVKHFPTTSGGRGARRVVRAVDGVSFTIRRRQTLGLVGESGSGKSTLGRLALRLIEPTGGRVSFDGQDITDLSGNQLRALRSRMQIVFQDPLSSFNPRMSIEQVLTEPMIIHGIGTPASRRARCEELLDLVGLPLTALDRFPHQFSGGQAQRIGIARALSTDPELIVCDEAVSALDVSIQAQILNLLRDLQHEFGISYLFIAHDLNVVRYMSDWINVMYLGKVVESGPGDRVMRQPRHPYTQALIEAIPSPDDRRRMRPTLAGEIPSPSEPPPGCHFHPRCPRAFEPCDRVEPHLLPIGADAVSCHLYDGAHDVPPPVPNPGSPKGGANR